jgi:hypothetical protein
VSKQGMIGMDLATQEMLGLSETLNDEQWDLPSGADGWSVKDVVAHSGCLMSLLVAAVGGVAAPDMGIEQINELQVAERRAFGVCQESWTDPRLLIMQRLLRCGTR